jgi:hypothetical protein
VLRLPSDEPLATSLHAAIRTGDVTSLKQLIDAHPTLVTAIVVKPESRGLRCTLPRTGLGTSRTVQQLSLPL